jgi:hypothetical protein
MADGSLTSTIRHDGLRNIFNADTLILLLYFALVKQRVVVSLTDFEAS